MAGDRDTQVDTQKRRAIVLSMRKSGATYRQIAKSIEKESAEGKIDVGDLPGGWDERYAAKDVKRELDRLRSINEHAANDIRDIEIGRLDEMILGIWPRAVKGHEGAIDRVLRIMKRRAELLGLDAPTKQELTGADGNPLSFVITPRKDAERD